MQNVEMFRIYTLFVFVFDPVYSLVARLKSSPEHVGVQAGQRASTSALKR